MKNGLHTKLVLSTDLGNKTYLTLTKIKQLKVHLLTFFGAFNSISLPSVLQNSIHWGIPWDAVKCTGKKASGQWFKIILFLMTKFVMKMHTTMRNTDQKNIGVSVKFQTERYCSCVLIEKILMWLTDCLSLQINNVGVHTHDCKQDNIQLWITFQELKRCEGLMSPRETTPTNIWEDLRRFPQGITASSEEL